MFTTDYVAPAFVNGQVVELTDEQKQAIIAEWNANQAKKNEVKVPQSVSMRQARIALRRAGLLGQVTSAINSMQGDAGTDARIEWDYSNEVLRNQPLTIALAQAIGMTEAEMDELFIEAAKL